MKAGNYLVIVESPTKAKTISRILGENFTVIPSMGHIIDLPKSKLGVSIENNFEPSYVIISTRRKVLSALKKEAKGKDIIYIATDPDREGEAIGWQIKNRIFQDKKVLRVVFHEITPAAVKEAFAKPREFDLNMIEAQAGRRILDRIVGYFLSPLLWKKVARGLSAGRVQSVALRLIIERERQITSFIPQEYWEIHAKLSDVQSTNLFLSKLDKIEGQKAQIQNKDQADVITEDLKKGEFRVADIKNIEKKRFAPAPFITSTLQQEAFNKLRFNGARTMLIAQQLYEGVDIKEPVPTGLITYMRTDSTHVAPEAIKEVRGFITDKFGRDYLPKEPNVYKLKKHAQAAHEAIRPTLVSKSPESIKGYLSPEQYKLYELIYNRFLASQMSAAVYESTTVNIEAGKYIFSASGATLIFAGFSAVYNHKNDPQDTKEGEEEEKEDRSLPKLEKGQILKLHQLIPSQHFTKPPAHFSDSSLVKILEEEGIGRPSTYAPTISTLLYRDYVRRLKGYLYPTELGFKICDLLVEYFPKVIDAKFTALMEDELDGVEEGSVDRIKILEDFYGPFKVSIDFAQENIKKEVVETKEICDKCGKSMVIKWGRKGKFLSCSSYPECKNAKSITTGIKCPQPGCSGEIIERHSRKGAFFGCTKYPQCTFTARTLPQQEG
ncbi:MAG: type I DNA topoisomerase [Candidatus Omnitrophota bacterium]